MERWPNVYKECLKQFYNGEYLYKEYEKWAVPEITFEEYMGIPQDIYVEPGDDLFEPPDPNDEYDAYLENKKKAEDRINELRSYGKVHFDQNCLIEFLQLPPLFPHSIKKFAQYISLVESIDLNKIQKMEKTLFNNMPSKKDIYDLFNETEKIMDGQEVDGKYFHINKKVKLPNQNDINTNLEPQPIGRGNIGNWKYKILNSKYDDEELFDVIEKSKDNNDEYVWIISPWKPPKTVIDYITKEDGIYISSHHSLKNLRDFLNKSCS